MDFMKKIDYILEQDLKGGFTELERQILKEYSYRENMVSEEDIFDVISKAKEDMVYKGKWSPEEIEEAYQRLYDEGLIGFFKRGNSLRFGLTDKGKQETKDVSAGISQWHKENKGD